MAGRGQGSPQGAGAASTDWSRLPPHAGAPSQGRAKARRALPRLPVLLRQGPLASSLTAPAQSLLLGATRWAKASSRETGH